MSEWTPPVRPPEPPSPLSDPPEILRSVGFVLLIIGFVFQLLHWPWEPYFLAGAWLVTLAAMAWRFAQRKAITLRTIARDLFTLALVSLLVMHMLHLPGRGIPMALLIVGLIGSIRYDRDRSVPRGGELRAPGTWLFYAGLVLVVIGTLFRIQHWPYGTVLLLGGLVLGVAGWFMAPPGPRSRD